MSQDYALRKLLIELFDDAEELRSFVYFELGQSELNDLLPGRSASHQLVAETVARLLLKRGLVDQVFFAALERVRPRRVEDIEQVRSLCTSQPRQDKPVIVDSHHRFELALKLARRYRFQSDAQRVAEQLGISIPSEARSWSARRLWIHIVSVGADLGELQFLQDLADIPSSS